MSTVVLGAVSVLEVASTSSATKTPLTGIAMGTDALTYGISASPRQVPGGRGRSVATLPRFDNYDFTSAHDSNATHDPLFRRNNCGRMWCEWYPEGKTSGKPKIKFEAIITPALTVTMQDDSVRWGVAWAVDGRPVETTV